MGFGGINERETGLKEQDKFAGNLLVAVKAKPEAFTYPLEGISDLDSGLVWNHWSPGAISPYPANTLLKGSCHVCPSF